MLFLCHAELVSSQGAFSSTVSLFLSQAMFCVVSMIQVKMAKEVDAMGPKSADEVVQVVGKVGGVDDVRVCLRATVEVERVLVAQWC